MPVMNASPRNPDLVLAAVREDPGARDRLVDAWLPVVLGWCARLGGAKVDAEDAAHDVLIVMLDRLPSLREPQAFHSWLFGITRRVLAKHRRQAWVKRWVPGFVPDSPDPNASPHRQAHLSEISRRVQEVLEQLPAAQREVLVLCDLEERTDLEVAELLGVPLGTVKSRLRLARQKFRIFAEQSSLLSLAQVTNNGGGRT
jgi:RNA polymerase sigma-70 factor (ECF subfamily)